MNAYVFFRIRLQNYAHNAMRVGKKSGMLDSNQWPQRPERRALPTALTPVFNKKAFLMRWKASASDGARTRGLRRDRPAR